MRKFWSENLKVKRSLGTFRHKGKENIKTALKETESKSEDWIYLAAIRNQRQVLLNTVMNLLFS
jgi:hypothetical protein